MYLEQLYEIYRALYGVLNQCKCWCDPVQKKKGTGAVNLIPARTTLITDLKGCEKKNINISERQKMKER